MLQRCCHCLVFSPWLPTEKKRRKSNMFMLVLLSTGILAVVSYLFYLVRDTGQSRASTSLDAYISSEASVKPTRDQGSKSPQPCYDGKPGRQILIMFATEYGFSEELASLLLGRLQALTQSNSKKWQPRILNAKHHQMVQWEKEFICFFIISTCGDGATPTEGRSLLAFLQSRQQHLHHLHVSVLALGDSSYPHFCSAGVRLADRLDEVGAVSVVPTTRVDGEAWGTIEGWFDQLEVWLQSSAADKAVPDLSLDYLDTTIDQESSAMSYSRRNPFMAKLKTKRLLTRVEDVLLDRETIHCELDVRGSGLYWTPGDSVGIYPMNNHSTVEAILSLLGLTGQEVLQIPKPAFRGQGLTSLREALEWYYDIRKVPVSTLSALSHYPNPILHHSNKLTQLLVSTKKCSEYLEKRNLVQVLADWCAQGVCQSLPPDVVYNMLNTLRPLQPRYYSIASCPRQDKSTISITVAVVRYILNGSHEGGVATTYLQDRLLTGQPVPVFISSNPDFRLPSDPTVPIILICAGTGLAPFMAFVKERELTGSQGEVHVYFGCRHPDKDFLYRHQLEEWEAKGQLRLRVAFSRYFDHKVYVQDLIAEDAQLLWTMIDKARGAVYVCGSADTLAPDVHKALVKMVQQQGQVPLEKARDYLNELEQAGRYLKDVWVA